MNKSAHKSKLLPFQEKIVEEYINCELGQRLILISPPGTGKPTIIVDLIDRLLKKKNIKKILLIAPGALVQYWASLFKDKNLTTIIIESSSIILSQYSKGSPIVFVGSIDKMKKPVIRQILKELKWDFICFDEAHELKINTLRGELFLDLKDVSNNIILLSSIQFEQVEIFSKFDKPFSVKIVKRTDVEEHFPKVITQVQEIKRNSIENEIKNKFFDLLKKLSFYSDIEKEILISRFNSSFYSLRRSLERIKFRTSYFADETPRKLSEEEMKKIDDLILEIDKIIDKEEDSKINSLLRIVSHNLNKKIVVLSQYNETLEYLELVLRETELDNLAISVLNSSFSILERQRIIKSYNEANKGILLASVPSLKGFELMGTLCAIWFDFSYTPEVLNNLFVFLTRIKGQKFKQIILANPEEIRFIETLEEKGELFETLE